MRRDSGDKIDVLVVLVPTMLAGKAEPLRSFLEALLYTEGQDGVSQRYFFEFLALGE